MSSRGIAPNDEASVLGRTKSISGWCIEHRRKRSQITQVKLAEEVGITVRWLREIESGNPKTSMEDHLRCASRLGLSTSYMLILMMFMERHLNFPQELLLDDLLELEERCIECIAEFSVASLARRLRPDRSISSALRR